MQFGKVSQVEGIDIALPKDHLDTSKFFKPKYQDTAFSIGCAKWNKQDLKGFYPKGTTDELKYYATQFNAIELNATFYRIFPEEQFKKWYNKTPADFKFYPKLVQNISHFSRLKDNSQPYIDHFLTNVLALKEKLGMLFLQMPNNFDPKNFIYLKQFVEKWPKEIPLAIELRHTDWFNDEQIANEVYALFENYNITNIITDTAGRRDLLHMRLTTPKTFIRWVGANHPSDYERLDAWVKRIKFWKENGIEEINFFVHQNLELESPLLSQYFIKQLNQELDTNLSIPKTQMDTENNTLTLF